MGKDVAKWRGLSGQEALQVEFALCKTANRPDVFGKTIDGTPCADHSASMMRVLHFAFKAAREPLMASQPGSLENDETRPRLKQHQLARKVGVNTTKMADVFNGTLSGDRDWALLLERGLRFIFCGDASPQSETDTVEVADRVIGFFLRESNHGAIPKFFLRERRYLGAPCSLQELAYEIQRAERWIREGRTGRLIIAGKGRAPVHCWTHAQKPHKQMGIAVHSALSNPDMQVIFLSLEGDSAFQSELDKFFQLPERAGLKERALIRALPAVDAELLNPFVQYVLLELPSQSRDTTLFIVRTGDIENFPLSWSATEDEKETFFGWLRMLTQKQIIPAFEARQQGVTASTDLNMNDSSQSSDVNDLRPSDTLVAETDLLARKPSKQSTSAQ